ncbi:hypothetical protein ACFSMW_07960 [Virgibacillus halophilus]|uniref:hypothetical protein n=1 Tax=Tigheibacillus halophilus TaxID=361280 RepID=UPI00363183D8
MEHRNVPAETTPHQDGKKEGVLKDAEGTRIGIRADAKTEETFSSLSEIQHPQMKKFEKMMRGEPVD